MDTWWIDKPHLLGSSNPSDADLEQLRGEAALNDFAARRMSRGRPRTDN